MMGRFFLLYPLFHMLWLTSDVNGNILIVTRPFDNPFVAERVNLSLF